MRHRIRKLLCAALLLGLLLPTATPATAEADVWDGTIAIAFGGGVGDEDNPYQIQDGRQLAYLAKQLSEGVRYDGKYFVLTGDINLNGHLWLPIGSQEDDMGFDGIFSGGGHVITGLHTDEELDGQGLFGYIDGGTVTDLRVESSDVAGRSKVGAVAAVLAGTLENCGSTATVTGDRYVGGVVGDVVNGGVLSGAYFGGQVSGADYVGGLAGRVTVGGRVQDGYTTGTVEGGPYAGGVAGLLAGDMSAVYSAGAAPQGTNCGPVAGGVTGTLSAGYYLIEEGAEPARAGQGVSVEELQGGDLLAGLNTLGDTVSTRRVWMLNGGQNDGFPILAWQFVDQDGWSNPYTDVDYTEWYYEPVKAAVRRGLFSGTSDTTFSPTGEMTRPMFVTVLGRLAEGLGVQVTGYTVSFADVEPDTWYTDYVAWAAQTGIVEGYSPDEFGVADSISREQVAAMLVRFAQVYSIPLTGEAEVTFADGDQISDWALEAVEAAAAAGLINGYSDGCFVPGGTASRAEVANVLIKFCSFVD